MARKRRGRSEGSIYQRDDGLWTASVSLGYDGNGKRRRKTVYGRTKQEVQEKLRALQDQAGRGQVADSPNVTMGAYLQSWLVAITGTVSEGTHGYYSDHVRLHISPRIGGTKLRSLTATAVQAFYGQMAAEGVSAALRRKVGTTLGVALAEAVRLHLVHANPVRDVRKPKPERKEMVALTAEQAAAFLEAAQADRLYALLVVAIDSGARQGELFGLEWRDVDLEAGCVHIRRALRRRNSKLTIGPPKTKASVRRIDLSRLALDALDQHRRRMLAEGNYRPDAPVFCDTLGGRLRRNNVTRRSFLPALKRAGLAGVRFHDLRHSMASLLLAAGESVKVVSERLGHSSAAMTLGVYAHVAPGAQAKAAAKLDALLRPSAGEGRNTA